MFNKLALDLIKFFKLARFPMVLVPLSSTAHNLQPSATCNLKIFYYV